MTSEVKTSVASPKPVLPELAERICEPSGMVRLAGWWPGQVWVTSFATTCPEARGEATAGVPKLGRRARTKTPIRSARRRRRSTRTPFFLCHAPRRRCDSDSRGRDCLASGTNGEPSASRCGSQTGSDDTQTDGGRRSRRRPLTSRGDVPAHRDRDVPAALPGRAALRVDLEHGDRMDVTELLPARGGARRGGRL